jgi:rSAM/selenodomain-associated transferase 1
VSDRALMVFVKYPEPGNVKTRLEPLVGAEGASILYRVLAEAVLQATVPLVGDYETLVFYAPAEAGPAMRAWLPGVRLLPQTGDDLGGRMSAAFARAFERGAKRVAIIGTDSPTVTRTTVVAALDALDHADVVLGPTEDGGYYLLALTAPRPELFRDISWSTSTVLDVTEARARSEGLSVHLLPTLRDIDTPEDLRAEWAGVRPLLKAFPDLRDRIEAGLGIAGGA